MIIYTQTQTQTQIQILILSQLYNRFALLYECISIGQSFQDRRKWTLDECVSSFANHVIAFMQNIRGCTNNVICYIDIHVQKHWNIIQFNWNRMLNWQAKRIQFTNTSAFLVCHCQCDSPLSFSVALYFNSLSVVSFRYVSSHSITSHFDVSCAVLFFLLLLFWTSALCILSQRWIYAK